MLSGKNLPEPSISLQPIIPRFDFVSANAIIFAKPSSGTTVSGLSIHSYWPLANLTARLFHFEKPTFNSFLINCTAGNFDTTISQLSYVELLSITIISEGIPLIAASTL